jgi:hypothetical protein
VIVGGCAGGGFCQSSISCEKVLIETSTREEAARGRSLVGWADPVRLARASQRKADY